MTKEQTKNQIVSLYKKRRDIDMEIKKLQDKLAQQLCPKEKRECEPEYCTFRITDTCPFLKEWRKILEEAQVPEDKTLDLIINYIEKNLGNKLVPKSSDSA